MCIFLLHENGTRKNQQVHFLIPVPVSYRASLALQMCIDPTLSVALGDKPPPLYICEECSQRIAG